MKTQALSTVILFLFSVAAVSGCSPAVRSTAFVQRPSMPTDHEIRIYRATMPECPYEEIGIVSSRQRNKLISMDKVLEAAKERARKMGGDAIIGLSEQTGHRGRCVWGKPWRSTEIQFSAER